MVGNLKKWKSGILEKTVAVNGSPFLLKAERIQTFGDTHWVDFSWEQPEVTFAGILEHAGILPIPPYLHRETAASDLQTYQTVYSKIKGSVAAPTAGLHFTPELLDELAAKGFCREELTLHVGAGTFKPVKSDTLEAHEMHAEYFSVNRSSIERLINCAGKIIAVGTTSVRTLESLYYAGVLLAARPQAAEEDLIIPQWMPYDKTNNRLSPRKALQNVLDCLDRRRQDKLTAATRLMIVPGYDFQIVNGIITNFHQPKSTLLLLVAAFAGSDWKRIYDYALARRFRFLSYGDCSLLIP
jgi:S-adenosylmethionine:tRNA ribosyltransferase-isomerase